MSLKRKRPKFRSGLETTISKLLDASLLNYKHESEILKYVVPETVKKYNPDFKVEKFPSLIVEAKGIFSSDDRKKMLLIKEQYPERRIVMIFGRAQNPIRKGSKTTYAAWCDDNGIDWVDIKQFKENPTRCLTLIAKKRKPKREDSHDNPGYASGTRKNRRTSKVGRTVCSQ